MCCSSDPTDIVAGPDGALWFTNVNSSWIGRISTQGDITKYPTPILCSDYGITAGPNNDLWFTCGATTGDMIGSITTSGIFTMYSTPTMSVAPIYIALGPDNALWFTEQYSRQIGRVTTQGVFTEYLAGTNGGPPIAITAGPDGAVWYGKLGYISQIVLPDATSPRITISASPNILWSPNGKMAPVVVRGTVSDTGSGVLASSVAYTVIDEYHQVQPAGHIALNSAGNYAFTVRLQASRHGYDRNGRQYMIQVSASDNAGNRGVKWIRITVPHNP